MQSFCLWKSGSSVHRPACKQIMWVTFTFIDPQLPFHWPHCLYTASLLEGFCYYGNHDISSMPVVRFCSRKSEWKEEMEEKKSERLQWRNKKKWEKSERETKKKKNAFLHFIAVCYQGNCHM